MHLDSDAMLYSLSIMLLPSFFKQFCLILFFFFFTYLQAKDISKMYSKFSFSEVELFSFLVSYKTLKKNVVMCTKDTIV